jgi:integrase
MTAYPLHRTNHPGIYRRAGKYVVIARDDRRRQVKRFADTLHEARRLKAELAADVARGEYVPRDSVRLCDYAREWIATYQGRTSRGFKESTRRDYEAALERHAIPVLGSRMLVDLQPRDIKRLAAHLADRGLSPSGVRRSMAPVKAMLATAFEEGIIRANPSANVRLAMPGTAKDPAERTRILTPQQVRELIAQTAPEHRPLITLLANTGLRIGEAVALEWGDIDLDARVLRVKRGYYKGEISTPKSRYGLRAIPLSATLVDELRRHYATSHAGWESPRRYVFGTLVDTIPLPANLSVRVMKPAARAAGVPWASFHTLRHTFASSLFRRGCNVKQVQAVLGHHSPAFTLDRYVHLIPEDLPNVEGLY